MDRERSTYLVGHVMDEAMRLLEMKEASYQEAWKDQGWIGNLARVLSKTSRLRNMLYKENVQVAGFPLGDDSVENQLLDLMNLTAFMLINYRHGVKWGHETPELEIPVAEPHRNRVIEDPFLGGDTEIMSQPQSESQEEEEFLTEDSNTPPARKRAGRK